MYFLIGWYDVNAPGVLTEQYYHALEAPQKALIWFEHSDHTSWTREPDRFAEVIIHTVLAETQPGR